MTKNNLQWVVKAITALLLCASGFTGILITNALSKLILGKPLEPLEAVVGFIPFVAFIIFEFTGFTKKIKTSLKAKTTVGVAFTLYLLVVILATLIWRPLGQVSFTTIWSIMGLMTLCWIVFWIYSRKISVR